MTDFSLLTEDLATEQIAERRRSTARLRSPHPARPHGRHGLAERLHRLADRLDA